MIVGGDFVSNIMKKLFDLWNPEEDYEEINETTEVDSTSDLKYKNKNDNKVVNIYKGKTIISCFKPSEYNSEILSITDKLLMGNVIVLDLELESKEPAIAQRIIDFLRGTIYAIEGKFVKVSRFAYVLSPHNVEINGAELISELADHDIYI